MNFIGKIRKGVMRGRKTTSQFDDFLNRCQGKVEFDNEDGYIISPKNLIFEFEEDLVLYQLTFDEIDPLKKVILPVIRRIMPTIIANEIIDIQPMNGSTAQLYTLMKKK